MYGLAGDFGSAVQRNPQIRCTGMLVISEMLYQRNSQRCGFAGIAEMQYQRNPKETASSESPAYTQEENK